MSNTIPTERLASSLHTTILNEHTLNQEILTRRYIFLAKPPVNKNDPHKLPLRSSQILWYMGIQKRNRLEQVTTIVVDDDMPLAHICARLRLHASIKKIRMPRRYLKGYLHDLEYQFREYEVVLFFPEISELSLVLEHFKQPYSEPLSERMLFSIEHGLLFTLILPEDPND